MEPTEAMKAMARRVADERCPGQGRSILWEASYLAALAAIMETQRLDAEGEAIARVVDARDRARLTPSPNPESYHHHG